MKDILKIVKIIFFFAIISNSKEDTCPENKMSISSLGVCEDIVDILEKADLTIEEDNLLFLASNNRGIVEKDNYRFEIFKLNDDKLQSQNIRKSKLFFPESCLKAMELDEKIKLDRTKGIVMLVYNSNEINANNLEEIFFVIRQDNENSQIKLMNSKTFDFSLCHEEPILFDNQVNINSLQYDFNNDKPIDIDKIMYAKKLKIDLFDPHSDFLKDICFKFTSEKNTDVPLDSRYEDYYQNITLCNESQSSHYIGFNYSAEDKIITYRCAFGFYKNLQQKESFISNINSQVGFLLSTSNINVITCYKKVLNLVEFLHNYGGLISILTFLIQIILYICFCCKGTKPLEEQIKKLFDSAHDPPPVKETPKNDNDKVNMVNNNGINTDERLNMDNNKKTEDPNNNMDTLINIDSNRPTQVGQQTEDGKVENVFKKRKNKKNKKKTLSNPSRKPKKTKTTKNKDKKNVKFDLTVDKDKDKGEMKLQKSKTTAQKKKEKKKMEDVKSEVIQIYELNDEEYNEMSYENALDHDKRNIFKYYWGILKISHIILNVFFRCEDYNLFTVKLGLLLMMLQINLTFNILFFTSKNIKATYVNSIDDLSNLFLSGFLNSFLSSILSSIFLIILKILCLTHNSIRSLRKIKSVDEAKKKSVWVIRCIKLRINLYYILSFIFVLVFGFYIACFCTVFENTQFDLIKSMFTSWFMSLLYPFVICFVTSIFRKLALGCKCKFFYRINKILQMI